MTAPIRVVIADDQPLLCASFATLIDSAPDLHVVGRAGTGHEAIERTRATGADVVLMDIRMPGLDGLAATRRITADADLAAVKVLILTTFEIDEYVFEALRSGASGFLGKSAEPGDLIDAIRIVHRGDALLSPAATRSLISRYLARPDHGLDTSPGRLEVLTEREREILTLVGAGLGNDDIARHLTVSPHTVKTHVNRTMTKLGAHERAQLVVIAYETGLVRPGRP
ncbi:response regulator transcription factor [Amorphoplanes nipponensis]|uniref:DNA-binding response regulator n=1 Tax=Actinoplanes nipponensis TaxID=135950 RepID=A0A919JDM8_9ACTN|nr:response regulator transcription factor [Actinoplanes nipponensis]GIE47455.1 DNA-binding response regulator [Actinoplanes nipponensis]